MTDQQAAINAELQMKALGAGERNVLEQPGGGGPAQGSERWNALENRIAELIEDKWSLARRVEELEKFTGVAVETRRAAYDGEAAGLWGRVLVAAISSPKEIWSNDRKLSGAAAADEAIGEFNRRFPRP
jgi:hypothetical protein